MTEEEYQALLRKYGVATESPKERTSLEGASLHDADTLKLKGSSESIRLDAADKRGADFDAFEVSDFGGEAKLASQREALEKLMRWEPGTATNEDVFKQGQLARKKAEEALKGGSIEMRGEQGTKGRDIGVAYDAQGNELFSHLNTPELNAGYNTIYNAKARAVREVQIAKQKALGDKAAGRVTDAEMDTALGMGENLFKQFASGTARVAGNILVAPARIGIHGVESMLRPGDKETFNEIQRKLGEGQDLTPEELAFVQEERTEKYGGTVNERTGMTVPEKVRTYKPFESLMAIESLKGFEGAVEDVQDSVSSTVNRSLEEEQQADAKGKLTQAEKEWERGDQIKAVGTGIKGLSESIVKHPGATLGMIVESAPEMIAQMGSIGISATANMVARADKGKEDFVKEHKREPNENEMAVILGTATLAAVIDAGANDYLTSVIRKGGKVVPSELVKSLTTSDKKVIAGVAKTLGTSPARIIGSVAGGMVAEAVDEGATNVLEQYAGKQDLDKVDFVEAGVSSIVGGAAGAGMKGGLEAPGIIADDLSDMIEQGKKQREAAKVKSPVNEPAVGEVTNKLTDDPVNNLEVLTNANYRVENPDLSDTNYIAAISLEMDKLTNKMEEALDGGDKEKVRELNKKAVKYNEILEGLRTAQADQTVEDTTKAIDEGDIKTTSQGVVGALQLGSKGESILNKLNEAAAKEDAAPELKEVATKVNDFVQKRTALQNSTKTPEKVKEEILGTGINESGKKGLGAHINDIQTALTNGSKEAVEKSLVALEDFRDTLASKYDEFPAAIEKARSTGEDQTINLGTSKFTIAADPNGIKKAENFVKRRMKEEVDVVSSGIEAMRALVNNGLDTSPTPVTTSTAQTTEPVDTVTEQDTTPVPTGNVVTNPDGSTTETRVNSKGVSRAVTTNVDGSIDVITTAPDGKVLSTSSEPADKVVEVAAPEDTGSDTDTSTIPESEAPAGLVQGPNATAILKLIESTPISKKARTELEKRLNTEGVTDESLANVLKNFQKHATKVAASKKGKASSKVTAGPNVTAIQNLLPKVKLDPKVKTEIIRRITQDDRTDESFASVLQRLQTVYSKQTQNVAPSRVKKPEQVPEPVAEVGITTTTEETTGTNTGAETEVTVETEPGVAPKLTKEEKEVLKAELDAEFQEDYIGDNVQNLSVTRLRKGQNRQEIMNRLGHNKDVITMRDPLGSSPLSRSLNVLDKVSKDTSDRIRKLTGRILQVFKGLPVSSYGKPMFLEDFENQPLLRLVNKNTGRLPNKLLAAMATVGTRAYATDLQESLIGRNHKEINKFTGHPEDNIPSHLAQELLTDVGSQRNVEALRMGREAMRIANIGVAKDADGLLEEKLASSIGEVIIGALIADGKLEVIGVPYTDLSLIMSETKDAGDFDFDVKPGGPIPTFHFIKVTNKRFSDKARLKVSTLREEIEGLTSFEKDDRYPLDKPKTEVRSKDGKNPFLKKTQARASDSLTDAVIAANKVRWVPKHNVIGLFNKLGRDNLLTYLGYVHDTDSLHVTQRKGATAKNQAILRQLDHMDTFMAERNAKYGEGSNEPFYFSHELYSQTRMGNRSKTINPIASKTHRHLIGANAWNTVVKFDNTDGSADALAFGLALSLGYKLTPSTAQDFKKEIYDVETNTWANTGVGAEVHEAVSAINEGTDTLTEAQQEAIFKVLGYEKSGTASMDALVNLAQVVAAREAGKSQAEVNLFVEVDGTTNGVISTLLQMPGSNIEQVKAFLRRGGIFFKGDEVTGTSEFLAQPGNLDNYQRTASSAFDIIRKSSHPMSTNVAHFMGNMVDQIKEEDGSVTVTVSNDGRKAGKVLLVFNYGAGPKSIKDNLGTDFVQKVYTRLTVEAAAVLDADPGNRQEALARYKTSLRTVGEMTGNYKLSILPQDMKEFRFSKNEERNISEVVGVAFGDPLIEAMGEVLGDAAAKTSIVNNAMRFVSEVLVIKFNQDMAEMRKSNGGKNPSESAVQELIRSYIEKGWAPGFKHATSASDAEMLPLVNMVKKTVPAKEGGVAQTPYTRKLPMTLRSVKGGSVTSTPSEGAASRTSPVRQTTMSPEIGPKAASMAAIAYDGNTNSKIQMDNDIANVYDAIGSGVNDIGRQTTQLNAIFMANHEHSHAAAIMERVSKAMELYRSMGTDDKAKLEVTLLGTVTDSGKRRPGALRLNKKDVPPSLSTWLKKLHSDLTGMDTASKELRKEIISVDQYNDGTNRADMQDGEVLTPTTAEGVIEYQKQKPRSVEVVKEQPATVPVSASKETVLESAAQVKGIGKVKLQAISDYLDANGTENLDGLADVKGIAATHVQALKGFLEQSMGLPAEVDASLNTDLLDNKLLGSTAHSKTVEDGLFGNVSQPITEGNVSILFDSIEGKGNKVDSARHKEHLKNLVNGLLAPVVARASNLSLKMTDKGPESVGALNTGTNTVYLVNATDSTNKNPRMSSQEVFAHEVTHILWEFGLNDDPAMYRTIKNMANQARKELGPNGYEIFLNKDAKGENIFLHDEAAERKAAKEMFDHIFNSTDYVREFATFMMTNEALRNAVGSVNTKTVKDKSEMSIMERLAEYFGKVIEAFQKLAGKPKGDGTIKGDLEAMAQGIAMSGRKLQTAAHKVREIRESTNTTMNTAAGKYILQPYLDFVDKLTAVPASERTRAGNIAEAVIAAPARLVDERFQNESMLHAQRMGYTRDNIVHKTIRELQGRTNYTKAWEIMLRGTKLLEGARHKTAVATTRFIKTGFKELSKHESVALTNTVIKTELVNLDGSYSLGEIKGMLTSDKKLEKEIRVWEDRLKKVYGKNANLYIEQAHGLGYHSATGKTGLSNQMLNAYTIAQLHALRQQDRKPVGNLVEAETMISILASLRAIQYTAGDAKRLTANVITREATGNPSDNGITRLLGVHQRFKEESLEKLFANDKVHTRFGYVKESPDPYITFEVGTTADEDIMRAKGYKMVGPIELDPNHKNSSKPVMYVSNMGLNKRRVSGVTDLESRRHSGTNIMNSVYAGNDNDRGRTKFGEMGQMRNAHYRDAKAILNGTLKFNPEARYAVPVLDPNGNVTDYRYMMAEDTKRNVLKMENDVADVLGQMDASIVGKAGRKRIDRGIVEQVKADFDTWYKKDPTRFVKISAQSSNAKYRELWQMLSSDMHEDMKEVFGKDEMYVQEELVDQIFGYKKLSLVNQLAKWGKVTEDDKIATELLNTLRYMSIIFEAIVNKAKSNVVLYSLGTIVGNEVSNLATSIILLGMGPVEAAKGKAEALREIRHYQAMERKRDDLARRLDTDSGITNRAEQVRELRELNADLKRSPLTALIKEGVFNTIVEDVETEDDQLFATVGNVFPSVGDFAEQVGSSLPKEATQIWDNLWLKRNTKAGKEVYNLTAHSDFSSRYAAYKHLTQVKGMSHEKAVDLIMDVFVNYDLVTSPALQWANDKGILMFTKFMLRIQRMILRSFKTRAGETLAFEMAQQTMGDVSDILDSNLPGQVGLDRLNGLFEVVDTAIGVPAMNMLKDTLELIF